MMAVMRERERNGKFERETTKLGKEVREINRNREEFLREVNEGRYGKRVLERERKREEKSNERRRRLSQEKRLRFKLSWKVRG